MQAREANLKIMHQHRSKETLVDRIEGSSGKLFSDWLTVFKGILDRRPSKKKGGSVRAASTQAKDDYFIEAMRKHFADSLVSKVTTQECHAFVSKFLDLGQERTANTARSVLVDCFREAESAGWIAKGSNPAEIIKAPKPATKRSRLTLKNFQTVLDASTGWAKTSLLLALITGQRVSDIAEMAYSNVRGGFLYVQQIKTGERIMIPLGIELLGYSLGNVIKQSRRIVGAKHIVHQDAATGRSRPGAQLRKESIGREFTTLLREHVKADWTGTPPTFHEIRSLSKLLHGENGIDTMALLGHESENTAKIYADPRGGWVEVKLPKSA